MSSGTHELKLDGVGKLLKDYKPKYSMIEVVLNENEYFGIPIGLLAEKIAKEKYGNWIITSVMDFNDTKTTSIILKRGI